MHIVVLCVLLMPHVGAQILSNDVTLQTDQWATVAVDNLLWYTPIDYSTFATINYARYTVFTETEQYSVCDIPVAKILCAEDIQCVGFSIQVSPSSCTLYYSTNGVTSSQATDQSYYVKCTDNCAHSIKFEFEHVDDTLNVYTLMGSVVNGKITSIKSGSDPAVRINDVSYSLTLSGIPTTLLITCTSAGVMRVAPPIAHTSYVGVSISTTKFTSPSFIVLIVLICVVLGSIVALTYKIKQD